MNQYLIAKEGIGGEPEPLGTFSGNSAAEAFGHFLEEEPDFEGEVEIVQLGATARATRYDGEIEIKGM